jgi:hypothetical protein
MHRGVGDSRLGCSGGLIDALGFGCGPVPWYPSGKDRLPNSQCAAHKGACKDAVKVTAMSMDGPDGDPGWR